MFQKIYKDAFKDELEKIALSTIGDISRSIFGYHNLNEISKKINIPKKM